MKLIITNKEAILQVGEKRIPAVIDKSAGVYKAICNMADIVNENCTGFPKELVLRISPNDKLSYHPFDEIFIAISMMAQLPICLHYIIFWKGDDLLNRATKQKHEFIDQSMEHFDSVGALPAGLYFNRYIPAEMNLHQAITDDLNFTKNFLGIK